MQTGNSARGSTPAVFFRHFPLAAYDETPMSATPVPRLTSLSHGGGCGCKLAPGVLADLLRAAPAASGYASLLVGRETADDAAVWQLNESQALVATTDFFMPIVDDPFDFGRIAATNALADVYAMGGRPILALALLAMPVNVLPVEVVREILRGGESICEQAGVPVAGGHSIDSVEPIYGLVALGLVHPRHLKRNCDARRGDALILGKPLGVGVLSAALRKGQLAASDYQALIDSTTRLNRAGPELAELEGVHAMTDVTGFGLLGHLLEMCRGAGLGARLSVRRIPLLPNVLAVAATGCVTGASARNWSSYGDEVRFDPQLEAAHQALLTDPQTSGGLLIACSAQAVPQALAIFQRYGFAEASVIGVMDGDTPLVQVEP
jgi:selenide,water dikinase